MSNLRLLCLILCTQLIFIPLCQAGSNKKSTKTKTTQAPVCMDLDEHTYGYCEEDPFMRSYRLHELGDAGGLLGFLLEMANQYQYQQKSRKTKK